MCTGSPPPTPLAGTAHTGLYICVCSALLWDTGLDPQNAEPEPVRTDCVEVETQTLSFSDSLLFPLADRERSFDSPRTLLHSRWSAHFYDWNNYGEQRPFGDADSCLSGCDYTACYWRWQWPCCLLFTRARGRSLSQLIDEYPHPHNPTTRSRSVLTQSTFLGYSLESRSASWLRWLIVLERIWTSDRGRKRMEMSPEFNYVLRN